MKKIILLFTLFSALNLSAQNIGVNSTGANPDNSAMLDVQSTNKGMLIPRVSLSNLTDGATISSPSTSLLVYNTNASLTGGVGFYYNSGTTIAPVWTKLITSAEAVWREQSSYVELIPGKQVYINNNVGIGISSPAERLHVADGNIKLGNGLWTAGNDRVVKFGDADYVMIGEVGEDDAMQLLAKHFIFKPSGSGSYSGNVGIGTTSVPTAKLEVNGSIKITDGNQGTGKILTSNASGTGTWTTPISNTTFRAISSSGQYFSVNTLVSFSGMLDDYDVGNNFFGGSFTVPATGAYHFDGKVEVSINVADLTSYNRVHLRIYKNGSIAEENIYHVPNNTPTSLIHTVAINENLQLAAGDQVSLQLYTQGSPGAGSASYNKVVFSGYRIY